MKRKFTGLRFKLLIFISVAVLFFFVLLYFLVNKNLLLGYSQLEKDKTLIQIISAESLLKEQSDQLSTVARDYAHWDDTYNFIEDHSSTYIKSNLNDTTYSNIKINAIIMVNPEGEIVFKKGLYFNTGKPWRIAKELEQAASKGGVLVNQNLDYVSGLLWTSDGLSIVSAFDIRDSELTKKRRGTLIFVRLLDKALVEHIGKILSANLDVQYSKQLNSPMNSKLSDSGAVDIRPLDKNKIVGTKAIKDVNGSENIILHVEDDREIFKQGNASLSLFYWSAALAGLVLLIYGWLVDKVVLKRLECLNSNVKNIDMLTSSIGRIQRVEGQDEIASLGQAINAMLGRLDASLYALDSEKKRSEVTLSTLSSIGDAVITCDDSARVTYMNAAAEQLLGIHANEVKGKTLASIVHLVSDDKLTPIESNWIINTDSPIEEVSLARADGKIFVINKSASQLKDSNGNFFGTVAVLHDVTALRVLSKQLSYQASHDLLTGLVNRYEFERKLQEAIDDSMVQNRTHCLAFLDLDQFKMVNDSCGHVAGDALLKQFSSELKAKMRNADTFGRLGGDEFAILLMGCDLDKAQLILNDILTLVRDYRFSYDDKTFTVGVSIGLTEITPKQSITLSELISVADAACYIAKNAGGNRIHQYVPKEADLKEKSQQFDWLSRINLALENNQFVLYMQSIKSLSGAAPHCEILIRMKGEGDKLYLPCVFLPVAERYKLMPRIDRWVVAETFSILAQKGGSYPNLCAINLSGQTLSDEHFLSFVIDKLNQFSIDPKMICFEITETVVISYLDKARHFIQTLRALGCKFSLDDFGSGLSSFGYLKNLEVDYLKIDGMFVKSIANNNVDRAMVDSINNIGHVMQLQTIAEFVESEEVIEILKEIGVDFAQGYAVAMPEPFY
jgi:diguanylate cyclase (GGDEF)-like protein/PAS domain S-box-containing protein